MSRSGPTDRLGRLRLSFPTIAAEAVLVSHLPNVRYLCGFTGSAGLLLVDSSSATLFTDSRYTLQARQEVSSARVQICRHGLIGAVCELLRARKGRSRVAYSGAMTVAQKRVLDAGVGSRVRWVDDRGAVEKLRAIKDAGELRVMREAAELISAVFMRSTSDIRQGTPELALAAIIESEIKRRGGSGPSFETIVAAGPRSAWAHARPTQRPIGKNELVVLDQGAILHGYCSDMTRTVFAGKASQKIRSLYTAVLEAQEAGKQAIRPGVTAGDVDRAARNTLKRAKLDRYFTHSLGHGLGLEVHEMPRLGKGEKTVLYEGMVLTVEPGIYVEGLGGIRIEDDVVVTSTGCQDLTGATRDFLEL
ncbi:MAG: Xaa-Pro peptidase family protein [Candidatus Acidiferrales bacterium]